MAQLFTRAPHLHPALQTIEQAGDEHAKARDEQHAHKHLVGLECRPCNCDAETYPGSGTNQLTDNDANQCSANPSAAGIAEVGFRRLSSRWLWLSICAAPEPP